MRPVLLLLVFFFLASCHQTYYQGTIEARRIAVDSTSLSDKSIEAFIEPYKQRINTTLDSVICYARDTYSKSDGELNTAIGNFMADAMYERCNPIFEQRHKQVIDFVLLNHGGIRAPIPRGDISRRTAYNVMPFENEVVVVALKGTQIEKMIHYLVKARRAHPISKQLKIELGQDFNLLSASIEGRSIEVNKIYYVATSDYLFNGGDKMDFFKANEGFFKLNYKVRNVLIDTFEQMDTIAPKIDDRFVRRISD